MSYIPYTLYRTSAVGHLQGTKILTQQTLHRWRFLQKSIPLSTIVLVENKKKKTLHLFQTKLS